MENKENEFDVWMDSDASEDSPMTEVDQGGTFSDGTEQITQFVGQWPNVEIRKITKKSMDGWKSESVLEELLEPDPEDVCDSVPQICCQKASFIVDITKLGHRNDITGDDTGTYARPSTSKQRMKIENGHVYTVKQDEACHFILQKRYYRHLGTPTFRRVVYDVFRSDGNQHTYSMLQYYFTDGKEKPLEYTSHGNSKEGGAFMPRRKSVLQKMKTLSKSLPPAKVVSRVLKEAGGAEKLTSISSTPRDRQQARDVKRNLEDKHHSRSGSKKTTNFDAMFRLSMQGDFVRAFELCKGGHPRAFCATDQQLRDLERYCSGPNAVVLEVDPTFSVGEFYFTCTTYRTKEFGNKRNGKNALIPGPYMLHATKTEVDYEFFARHVSQSIKHHPITTVGSDGEKAIQNGFRKAECFKNSSWLLCMLHGRENCKRKLIELGIDPDTQKNILDQIYGYEVDTHDGRIRTLGLVDVETPEEFDDDLLEVIPNWDYMESRSTGKDPKFSNWFVDNKATETKASMLAPLRRAAGLGQQPRQFTTNDVESENMNVKRAVDFQKKTWDEAANILHARVLATYEELCRAIYQDGEYRLKPEYQHLGVAPGKWAGLTLKDRQKQLQKANLRLPPGATYLTVTAEESGIGGYSISDLKTTWQKAELLFSKDENITQHPRDQSKTVVFDEDEVYTVQKTGQHMFTCTKCELFKQHDSLFCPHTLAVAEKSGTLPNFLGTVNTKLSENSTRLLNAAVGATCRGSGQKSIKRKGLNNRLAQDIQGTKQRTSSSSASSSVPATSSVLVGTGPGATCARERMQLPPLSQLQVSMQETQPFTVTFRQGLIRRCTGCNSEFSDKTKNPPHDLILKKKDFREYPKDGMWFRANSLTNTYYHLSLECIRFRFPRTQLKYIYIYDEVRKLLTPPHIALLHKFGLHSACTHE